MINSFFIVPLILSAYAFSCAISPMLMDVPPFNDNNVRLALKYALNREEMLQLILKGHGTVGNDNPVGPSYRYYSKELKPIPYDPEKAASFLVPVL